MNWVDLENLGGFSGNGQEIRLELKTCIELVYLVAVIGAPPSPVVSSDAVVRLVTRMMV